MNYTDLVTIVLQIFPFRTIRQPVVFSPSSESWYYMNPHDLFVQGLGVIGLLFSVFSFQMNRHRNMMLMQIGACFFFGLQYFFLKAYTGTVVDIFSLIRNVIFIFRDRKWAKSPLWIVLFCIIFILSGVFTWDGIASLFMTLAMVINTVSFSVKNPKLIRGTILVSSPMVLVYCIMTGSIGGIINEILVEISSVVGLFRYDIRKKGNGSPEPH